MNKINVTIELDVDLKERLEDIAGQMGVTVSEWCASAVIQQVMMQESMEEFFLYSGQSGFDLEEMDFEAVANQLFSRFLEMEDDELEGNENKQTPKLILPDFSTKTVKDED